MRDGACERIRGFGELAGLSSTKDEALVWESKLEKLGDCRARAAVEL